MTKIPLQLKDVETGKIAVSELHVADNFFTRLKGLQFSPELKKGEGIILIPCRSVHTFMMGFAIDLIMIDSSGNVLTVHRNVKPWQVIYGAKNIHAVIELAANTADVQAGTRLEISAHDDALPKSLRFLTKKS